MLEIHKSLLWIYSQLLQILGKDVIKGAIISVQDWQQLIKNRKENSKKLLEL